MVIMMTITTMIMLLLMMVKIMMDMMILLVMGFSFSHALRTGRRPPSEAACPAPLDDVVNGVCREEPLHSGHHHTTRW
jgi:hypothetical protein